MKCLLKFFFETFKALFQRQAFFQNLKGTLHFHGKLFFDEKMDFKWVNVREYREVYVCVWKREQGDILWTKLVQKAVDFHFSTFDTWDGPLALEFFCPHNTDIIMTQHGGNVLKHE